MQERINLQEIEPKGFEALFALEKYIQNSDLSRTHLELIKIRASQINGCAFCIDMHTKDALKYGETQQRIFLLNAWKDTTLFTAEEKAILALTEEITQINIAGVSDSVYSSLEKLFDSNYIAQLIMAITTINAWNRIVISTNKTI